MITSARAFAASASRLPLAATALVLLLSGCSSDGPARLEGERTPVRNVDPVALSDSTTELRPLPIMVSPLAWTHAGGDAAHSGGNLPGPTTAKLVWRASAGTAPADLLPPGTPVASDGRIYVRDGASGVRAFDAASGRLVWTADLTLDGEDDEVGYGGGLALGGGALFATTGFGEVLALDPASGAIRWRARGDAPYRSAPVATQGQVVAVSAINGVIGFDAADGTVAWRSEGQSTRYGNLGRGSPAAAPGAALIPFGSGELSVIRIPSGVRVWSVNLGVSAGGEGLAAFSDLTSGPVLAGTIIVAGTASGQLAGIDGRNGGQIWKRSFGSLSPVWVAGDSVYVVTTEPRLLRLDASTGRTMWARTLDGFEDMEDRDGQITWAGPVLAGGRAWITSSDGRLLAFDGVSGEPRDVLEMPGGSVTGPIAYDGTIYVQTDDGQLLAYR
ncbi:MAG: outer membrane protein assembly factor BamB [Paracoccaceae bacterium]